MQTLFTLANEFANKVRNEIAQHHPYSPIKEPTIGDIIREYNICRKEEELESKTLDEIIDMVLVNQDIKRVYDRKSLLRFDVFGYTLYIDLKGQKKVLDADKKEVSHPKFWLALLLISVEPNCDSIAGIQFQLQ